MPNHYDDGEYKGSEHATDVFRAPKPEPIPETEGEKLKKRPQDYIDKGELDEYGNPIYESTHWSGWPLSLLGKVGDAFEAVDKAVLGRIGTEDANLYTARRGTIDKLSEQHFVLGLLGEIFIPDTVDIATAGLAYIPNRFRKLGKAGVKLWAKLNKGGMAADSVRLSKLEAQKLFGYEVDEFGNLGQAFAHTGDFSKGDVWNSEDMFRVISKGEDIKNTNRIEDALPGREVKFGSNTGAIQIPGAVVEEVVRKASYGKRVKVPVLDGVNITLTRRYLRNFAKQKGYAKDVVDVTARRTLKAPAELGGLYLPHAEAYFKKVGNFDEFPLVRLEDGTILKPKIKDSKTGRAAFVDPFDTHKDNIKNQIDRLVKSERLDETMSPADFIKNKNRDIKRLQKSLDKLERFGGTKTRTGDIVIEGHHIVPLDLAHRFYENLTKSERSYLTGHLAGKKVFVGNNPLNAAYLPKEVHTLVHKVLSDKLKTKNFDFNAISNLKVEDRIQHLDEFAELMLESQEDAWKLLDDFIFERGGNVSTPQLAERIEKLLGTDLTTKMVDDLKKAPDDIKRQILRDANRWNAEDKKRWGDPTR